MELAGRVALVTGSTGRGMGRSIALTLAREGADVALNYESRPARAETVRDRIAAMGRRVSLQQADVATEEGARTLFGGAIAELGKVDILVVSAGGAWSEGDVAELDPAHWRGVLAEEVHAPLYLIPLALAGMRERRWGRIILLGGHAADDWSDPSARLPIDYPLGKNARHWLARTLGAHELAHGITVNAIAPGEVPYVELDEALADAAQGQGWRSRPAPRPQDAGEVAAFLCSEAGRFVTGSVINVVAPRIRPVET